MADEVEKTDVEETLPVTPREAEVILIELL